MTIRYLIPLCALSLLAGCSSITGKNKPEKILSDNQIEKALASAKPPQQFGFAVYSTGSGIAMRGSARLHPMQVASVDFLSGPSPVIRMEGSASRMTINALVDPASADTWFEYSTAMDCRATFLGLDGRTIGYSGNTYIGAKAYAAVIPQLRIKQLMIENAPVYVRMAVNSLGPLGRGIQNHKVEAVIGYDTLQNFEFIRIDLARETIVLSASQSFSPNEEKLVGTASIVQERGAGLVVQGGVNGNETPIILDFAGQFGFALNQATMNTTSMVEVGEVVYVNAPTIQVNTGDGLPRVGAGLLRNYIVTICPRAGVVYFEQPER